MSMGFRLAPVSVGTIEDKLRVSRGLDEEETAMNAGVLDVTVALGGEFLPEIGRMLIFNVLDDRIPTKIQSRCN
jgi:hypothetical protein